MACDNRPKRNNSQSESILNKLLEFDNVEEILNFRFKKNNIMMWPYVRNRIYGTTLLKEYCDMTSKSSEKSEDLYVNASNMFKYNSHSLSRVSLKSIIKYVFVLIKESPSFYLLKNKKIIILGSDRSNEIYEKGEYSNWLNDSYANIFPEETLIIEKSVNWRFRRPRAYKDVIIWDPIIIKSRIYSKLSLSLKEDMDTIKKFISYLKTFFPYSLDENIYSDLSHYLVFIAKRINIETKIWRKIFKKTNARVLFSFFGGSGEQAHIIKLANEMNIICCELQHGRISYTQMAYNYGDRLTNNLEYKTYIPKYLLTFGEYWNNQIHSSTKPIVIGCPKMWIEINEHTYTEKLDKSILFGSDIRHYSIVFKTIEELIKSGLDSSKFILRPHPLDHKIMDQYRDFALQHNIKLDLSGIINESLSKSYILISPPSTIVFEALKYNIHIFIYNTLFSNEFSEGEFIKCFSDTNELYQMIISVRETENDNVDFDHYFDKNWKLNYYNFIKGLNAGI